MLEMEKRSDRKPYTKEMYR